MGEYRKQKERGKKRAHHDKTNIPFSFFQEKRFQRETTSGDLTFEHGETRLILGSRRRLDINRNLLHRSQRRHDIDSVRGLGRDGGHLDAFGSIRVITTSGRRLRLGDRLHDGHGRSRGRRRRRRRSGERAISSGSVHRRRDDRLSPGQRLRLRDVGPVPQDRASVGPAPLAASAQADAAAGDRDEHDDVEDEFEHDAENDAEHVDEVLKIIVVHEIL